MNIETLFQSIQYVTLLVTEGCNLSCDYCKVSASATFHRMPIEIAKRTVQLLVENSYARNVSVNLHGGEPLLMSDEWIDELISFGKHLSKQYSKNISFPATTNGTLLSQQRLQKLLNMGMSFSVSCDGPPSINDLMRQRGKDVQRSIQMAQVINYFPSIMAVIHQKNYNKISEMMNWYFQQGASSITTNFITPQGRGAEEDLLEPAQMLVSTIQAVEFMYETNLSVISNPLIHSINWFANGEQDKSTISCYKSECVAGKSILSVDFNGNMSLCAAIDLGEYIIGMIFSDQINEDEYRQALNQFHDSSKSFVRCQTCAIKHICTHGCTAACNKSRLYKENYCSYTHLLWDYLNEQQEKIMRIHHLWSSKVKHVRPKKEVAKNKFPNHQT